MATGKNKDYIAYIEDSEEGQRIKEKNGSDFEYVKQNNKTIKRGHYGRVIKNSHIKRIEKITEKEKINGIINENNKHWVPIEINFKEDDLYYKPNKEYINWSVDKVNELRKKSGAYIKNERYYFKEGIFISIGGFADLKARYTKGGVIDHTGNILVPVNKKIVSAKFLTGILNSKIPILITHNFINSEGLETTDLNYIPIPIPTDDQKESMEQLVNKAISIQKGETDKSLEDVQDKIDDLVENIYGVSLDE